MKIFKDSKYTQEIELLDFGILPAGESKTYVFYVLNDSNALLKDLEFIVDHNELKILEFPKELNTQTVGELTIEWSHSVTLKEVLKTQLKIKGTELWGWNK